MAIALAGGGLVYQQVQGGSEECSYPSMVRSCFPDETNTGVPNGTSLTPISGAFGSTSNGQIIQNIQMDDECLIVSHINVVVRNSQLRCVIPVGDAADTANPQTHVYDSTFICDNALSDRAIHGYNILVERVDITICENGADINTTTTIRDSYFHDLGPEPIGEAHVDGIQVGWGQDSLIEHNTILSRDTSAIAYFNYSYPTFGDADNWTITRNLLGGVETNPSVAYTIYCAAGTPSNAFITDNSFISDPPPDAAYYREDTCNQPGITISGNIRFEDGAPRDFNDPFP